MAHDVEHRMSKYLNNVIEADQGALKCVIRPTRGFQRMRTAYATIRGFEVMCMIRRGHCILQQPEADRRNPSHQQALRSHCLSDQFDWVRYIRSKLMQHIRRYSTNSVSNSARVLRSCDRSSRLLKRAMSRSSRGVRKIR